VLNSSCRAQLTKPRSFGQLVAQTAGLSNLGNTCYLNSVLQMMASGRAVREAAAAADAAGAAGQRGQAAESVEQRTAVAFQRVLLAMCSTARPAAEPGGEPPAKRQRRSKSGSSAAAADPTALWRVCVQSADTRIAGLLPFVQQDAADLFVSLADRLRSAPLYGAGSANAMLAAFQFELEQAAQCECGRTWTRFAPATMLQLLLRDGQQHPGPLTLESLLARYATVRRTPRASDAHPAAPLITCK
jgi:uncharacterized UBP type Zn finger protein